MENHDERRSGEGFRKIGALLPQVSNMPENGASMSAPKSSSLETTTLPRGRPLPTSTPAGGRGVATRSSLPPSVWQNDRAMTAQFKPSVRSWLTANQVVEVVTGDDGQFESTVLIRYNGQLAPGPDVDEALVIIEVEMRPADENEITLRIGLLWEMTSHPQSGGDNLILKFSGYSHFLMDYPADVAFEAIDRIESREKWFPSKSELKAECDRLVRWRRVTRDALAM